MTVENNTKTEIRQAGASALSNGAPPKPFSSMGRGPVFKKLIPWLSKGGLAILDQGLISGSNFLMSVLLARWLVPAQYGAYAVAFGIYVFLSVVYQSLVLEPMSVFGGSSYRKCLREYMGSLVWVHGSLSLAMFVVFGASALVVSRWGNTTGLAGALAGVTIASPCILAFALSRRTFYLELSPGKAALGALVYSAVVVGGLYVLDRRGVLSAFTAFLLMGLSALATTFYLFIRLRVDLARSGPGPTLRETWKRHWGYGRWALASAIAGWIPAYIYYPLLGAMGNIVHSGQLKALMNLTLPLEQTKAALGMLLLPYAARIHGEQGQSGATKLSVRMTMISLGGAAAYWLLILPLQGPVMRFLYAGRYGEVVHLLPLIAFGSVVWSAAYGPAIALRAMESPDSVFMAFSLATGISLLIGVPATWVFGLQGAIWGSNLADVLSLLFVLWVLRRKIRSSAGRQFQWGGSGTAKLAGEIPAE